MASGASPSMFLSTSLPDTRQASQRHGSNSMRGVRDQLRPADVKPKAAPLDPIKSASLLEPPQDKVGPSCIYVATLIVQPWRLSILHPLNMYAA